MKKLIPSALSIFSYLFLASSSFAQTDTENKARAAAQAAISDTLANKGACPPAPFNILCGLGSSQTVIGATVNLLFVVAIIIAVIFLIYGGIRWIMSKGEKEKVEESRNHVVAAIVGLIMILLAYFIINLVISFFGLGGSISALKLPQLAPVAPK